METTRLFLSNSEPNPCYCQLPGQNSPSAGATEAVLARRRHAARGARVSTGLGFLPRRDIDNRLGELVGVPRAFGRHNF
jgi:hypothetical protein